MLIYWEKDASTIKYGFSNRGMYTTTGTSTTVYRHAALIKKHKIQKGQNSDNHIKCFPSFRGSFEKFVTVDFLLGWGVRLG
jgi:hypothetical protein